MATPAIRKSAKGKWRTQPMRSRGTRRRKEPNPVLDLVDRLRAIGRAVPAEEWERLPRDFNENLDHYLYGSPKKRPSRE
jgi:hypothetical protein